MNAQQEIQKYIDRFNSTSDYTICYVKDYFDMKELEDDFQNYKKEVKNFFKDSNNAVYSYAFDLGQLGYLDFYSYQGQIDNADNPDDALKIVEALYREDKKAITSNATELIVSVSNFDGFDLETLDDELHDISHAPLELVDFNCNLNELQSILDQLNKGKKLQTADYESNTYIINTDDYTAINIDDLEEWPSAADAKANIDFYWHRGKSEKIVQDLIDLL